MKNKLLIILSLAFAICFCSYLLSYGAKSREVLSSGILQSGCTVVIDAGHGGRDAGTIGFDGTNEKDINLEIALALYDFLNVCGIRSVLIRNGDYEFYMEGEERNRSDLYNRLDFVNSIENSALISIHQNHFEDESEWGAQIWYSANTPESKQLAEGIINNIKEFLQPDNKRENMESDSSYYILYKAKVPSIMVECGFMSNEKENALLKQSEYQRDMAFSITTGICNLL